MIVFSLKCVSNIINIKFFFSEYFLKDQIKSFFLFFTLKISSVPSISQLFCLFAQVNRIATWENVNMFMQVIQGKNLSKLLF